MDSSWYCPNPKALSQNRWNLWFLACYPLSWQKDIWCIIYIYIFLLSYIRMKAYASIFSCECSNFAQKLSLSKISACWSSICKNKLSVDKCSSLESLKVKPGFTWAHQCCTNFEKKKNARGKYCFFATHIRSYWKTGNLGYQVVGSSA